MTRIRSTPSIRQARPSSRTPRPRDSLFAATMLVPVAVIAVLAASKIASRRIGHPLIAQQAHPQQAHPQQQQLAALPSDPSVVEPVSQAPARPLNDRAVSLTDMPEAEPAPAAPDLRPSDPRDPTRQAGEQGTAEARVTDGLQLAPNDPKSSTAPSSAVKARGDTGRAERERARRAQQLSDAHREADERAPSGAGSPADAEEGASPRFARSAAAPSRDVEVARRMDDDPTSLAYPPAPFMPEERTAIGTAPRYRPVASTANDYPYRPVLDTSTPVALPAPTALPAKPAPQQRDRVADQSDGPTIPIASQRGGASFNVPSDIGIPGKLASGALTAHGDGLIAPLHEQVAPSVQAGLGVQARSGESGMDRLTELAVPLEAEFSPAGYGRVKVAAMPTALEAGSVGRGTTNLQRFGSGALGLTPTVAGPGVSEFAYSGARPSDQRADGVGLAASYTLGVMSADVGTTPLGFPITHVVGGLALAPQITDTLRLRLTGERRALTDSVLSYAGTRDARTGTQWGGEVRTRGRADVEFDIGPGLGYIGAGGGAITGIHTASNSETEFGAGASFPVYSRDTQSLRVGLDLAYFSYRRNLRFFTLGQGGYFSPQSYVAALVPILFKEQVSEDLSYEVGGAIGLQRYHENASEYYPRDPALQTQLVALQADPTQAVAGLRTSYAAENRTGVAGNGHASVDYRITPNLHLGARAGILRAGAFTEASGVAYARYVFSGTDTQ